MTTRLILRPAAAPAPRWLVDACPLAYDEPTRQQFGAMPGVAWVKDSTAPNGRGFFRGPREAVEIVAALLESAAVVRVHSELPALCSAREPDPVSGWFPVRSDTGLRSYQLEGAAWCAHMLRAEGGALLADDMGIGKSAQALAAADAIDAAPLVVAPANTLSGWGKQAARWLAAGACHALSYEGFTKHAKAGTLPPHGLLVVDEIHYAANPTSKRSKALAEWRTAHAGAPMLGLSGTPMTARPRDLWHPLNLLWPGRFGTKWAFEKRYCDGQFVEIPNVEKHVWVADGASRSPELHTRLSRVMLRRTKADVALELPPRERVVVDVDIPVSARKALARAARAIDGKGGVSDLLSNIEEYKIEAACELAQQAATCGERVLVLTTRRATAEIIGKRLGAPHADGSDSPAERERRLAGASTAVATLYAVGTGTDYLSGFSTLIMVGLDWVPSVILQGEARVHRIGSTKPVTIYYLIGRGTLDEVVRERVLARLDQFAGVVGGEASGLGGSLGGGTEEELIAGIIGAVKAAA